MDAVHANVLRRTLKLVLHTHRFPSPKIVLSCLADMLAGPRTHVVPVVMGTGERLKPVATRLCYYVDDLTGEITVPPDRCVAHAFCGKKGTDALLPIMPVHALYKQRVLVVLKKRDPLEHYYFPWYYVKEMDLEWLTM